MLREARVWSPGTAHCDRVLVGSRRSGTGTRGPDFTGSLCHSLSFTSHDEPKEVHTQLSNRIGFAI